MRRSAATLFTLAILTTGCAGLGTRSFPVVETGIPEMRQALADGRITSRQIVIEYLTRIALYEDQLKAIIMVNPRVLEEAEHREGRAAEGGVEGAAVRMRIAPTGMRRTSSARIHRAVCTGPAISSTVPTIAAIAGPVSVRISHAS